MGKNPLPIAIAIEDCLMDTQQGYSELEENLRPRARHLRYAPTSFPSWEGQGWVLPSWEGQGWVMPLAFFSQVFLSDSDQVLLYHVNP
ncbi:MAG: hypothetical protein EA395_08430 [Phormidium sp. GEM2.Bin31]|nr:MAG: hypothetical protein EA395_08430 [Phormidium sp. GEM2.Bin31]